VGGWDWNNEKRDQRTNPREGKSQVEIQYDKKDITSAGYFRIAYTICRRKNVCFWNEVGLKRRWK
jgi:hypothetical protein